MASTYKTELELNQWLDSDKPRMEDFNRDNRIVDEKLRELSEEKAGITNSLTNIGSVYGPSTLLEFIKKLPPKTGGYYSAVTDVSDVPKNFVEGLYVPSAAGFDQGFTIASTTTGTFMFRYYRAGNWSGPWQSMHTSPM